MKLSVKQDSFTSVYILYSSFCLDTFMNAVCVNLNKELQPRNYIRGREGNSTFSFLQV